MDVLKSQALRDILKDKALLKDKCYVNGKWLSGATAMDVANPVNGDVITSVPNFGRGETAEAIRAAHAAQKGWAAKTARERAKILRKWQDLMLEHQEDLAADHDG